MANFRIRGTIEPRFGDDGYYVDLDMEEVVDEPAAEPSEELQCNCDDSTRKGPCPLHSSEGSNG